MGKFLQTEKPKQVAFKRASATISDAAKAEGIYKEHAYPFCLPRDLAEENLYPSIRTTIRDYFERNKIKWHDGQDGKPSNHMCDSQVCCANFLFPFADKPKALAALLRPIFPDLQEMLPIENGLYVAFEWIGQENYLKEKISRNGQRTRGANFTSADAAVRFRRTDGREQISLIEWKYTESYSSVSLEVAASGQSRVEIYRWLLEQLTCPTLCMAGEAEAGMTLKIARDMYEKLPHPQKKLVIFTEEQGGAAHCQVDNPELPNRVMFDWLNEVLSPR